MQRILTLVAGGLIGCVGAWVGLNVGGRSDQNEVPRAVEATRSVRGPDAGYAEMIEDLKARVSHLEFTPPEARVPVAGDAGLERLAVDLKPLLVPLLVRLDALEATLANGRQPRIESPVRGTLEGSFRGERQRRVEDARMRILDPAADEEAKLEAWRMLRSGGWTDDTVEEMIRLAQATTDPGIRADIWRQADAKDTNLALVQPLLDSLTHDPDARVRSEAAETLVNYVEEPGVRLALQYAAEHDGSADVREHERPEPDLSVRKPQNRCVASRCGFEPLGEDEFREVR